MQRHRARKDGEAAAQATGLFACGLLFLFSRFLLPGILLSVRDTFPEGTAAAWTSSLPDALVFAAALLAALETVRLVLVLRARAAAEGTPCGKSLRLRDEKRIGAAVLRERVFGAFALRRDEGATVGEGFASMLAEAAGTELEQAALTARERLRKGDPFLKAVEGTGLLSERAEEALRTGADHRRIAEVLREDRDLLRGHAERTGSALVLWACWGLIATSFALVLLFAGRG